MKNFFVLFVLLITCSLHAVEKESYTPLDAPSIISNTDEADEYLDQEPDPSLEKQESLYVIVSKKNSSPLMMFPHPITEGKKDIFAHKSTLDFSTQCPKNCAVKNPSSEVNRSSTPAALTEKRNDLPFQSTLLTQPSSLIQTLIYCPGCKQWHKADDISKQRLPQILFIKNLQKGYWHPICRKDQTSKTLLLQKALLQDTSFLPVPRSTEKNFYLIINSDQKVVLYHLCPATGILEKSSFQDPINELPIFSHWASILLQAHPILSNYLIHGFFMHALEHEKNILESCFSKEAMEKTPLLPKGIAPINYSSISTEN